MNRLSTLLRRTAVAPVRFYQLFISPVLPPSCRFHPTCSAYAVEAVLTHGVLQGCLLTLRRLARCHPWSPGGFDPVPPARPSNLQFRIQEHPDHHGR